MIDTWRAAHFEHSSGIKYSLPLTTKNAINYLSLKALVLQPITTTHSSMCGIGAQTLALHVAYGHCPVSVLQRIIDDGFITGQGVPKKLAPLPF